MSSYVREQMKIEQQKDREKAPHLKKAQQILDRGRIQGRPLTSEEIRIFDAEMAVAGEIAARKNEK